MEQTNIKYDNLKDYNCNMHITFSQTGKVLQENNYYPFGMSMGESLSYLFKGTNENKYLYQGQELQNEFGLNWYAFKYRNYMPDLGRFFNIDPLADQYAQWSPYIFSGNSVINAIELEGLEPVFLYELAKMVSPVAVNFSASFGTERKGIGVNVSIGIPQILPYSERLEVGISYYADDILQKNPVMETRSGREQSIFGLVSKKTTSFSSGETSQTLGELRIGVPFANIKTSNDVEGMGDGGDRFRTAALQVNFMGASAGFNIGTGDPGLKFEERYAPFGFYEINSEGKNPNEYRLGLGYVSSGPFRSGINSEKLRSGIQNNYHDLFGYPNFILDENFNDKLYFEFSFGGSTIWE